MAAGTFCVRGPTGASFNDCDSVNIYLSLNKFLFVSVCRRTHDLAVAQGGKETFSTSQGYGGRNVALAVMSDLEGLRGPSARVASITSFRCFLAV